MIKEFGVDPEVMDSPESFYRIKGYFGIQQFRLIRNFPNDWASKVFRSIRGLKPRQKLQIIEDLNELKKELINSPYKFGSITYSYNLPDWYSNAQKYHVLNPFDGIICNKNPNSDTYICRPSELNTASILEPPIPLVRKSEEIAKSVKSLFLYADEIHLVDPYFATLEPKFIRPLKKMINFFEIRERMGIKKINRFVYHTSANRRGNSFIESTLKREISSELLSTTNLEIIGWPEVELHNRMILSNIGGIIFGIGLDDSEDSITEETDTIKPLTCKECKDMKGRLVTSDRYMGTGKRPIVTITGTKII